MPQTAEAIYHDGVVELKQKPAGIRKSRALVLFLDPEEVEERHGGPGAAKEGVLALKRKAGTYNPQIRQRADACPDQEA